MSRDRCHCEEYLKGCLRGYSAVYYRTTSIVTFKANLVCNARRSTKIHRLAIVHSSRAKSVVINVAQTYKSKVKRLFKGILSRNCMDQIKLGESQPGLLCKKVKREFTDLHEYIPVVINDVQDTSIQGN